jgi:plasmid stabilization system protein ParE
LKRPLFRAAAAADVEDACRWYEAQRPGLGDEFLGSLAAALEAIERHPEGAAILYRDTRRQLLNRFPYGLHYQLIEGQIVVVACFHAKRNPRAWHTRS